MSNYTIPPGTAIGHVHLKVADLERALGFYCGVLGFTLTQRYGGQAAFVAAGGYHHHLGANTWASPGARSAGARDARLLEWTIELPTATDVAAVAANLRRRGFAPRTEGTEGNDVVIDDPWGTTVRVVAG